MDEQTERMSGMDEQTEPGKMVTGIRKAIFRQEIVLLAGKAVLRNQHLQTETDTARLCLDQLMKVVVTRGLGEPKPVYFP